MSFQRPAKDSRLRANASHFRLDRSDERLCATLVSERIREGIRSESALKGANAKVTCLLVRSRPATINAMMLNRVCYRPEEATCRTQARMKNLTCPSAGFKV